VPPTFEFRIGNDDLPANWTVAPSPKSVTVRTGAGSGGSDRVSILWNDNDIQKEWLQVMVKATSNTGLAAPDIFYFGNAVGETGDNTSNAVVDLQDDLAARNNKSGFSPVAITNAYDFNRDQRVDANDELIARDNHSGSTPLQLIDLSSMPFPAQTFDVPYSLPTGGKTFM